MKRKLGHMVQIRVNVMLLTSLLMDLCGGGGGGGGGRDRRELSLRHFLEIFIPQYFKYPVPVPSPWLEVCDRSGFKKISSFPCQTLDPK